MTPRIFVVCSKGQDNADGADYAEVASPPKLIRSASCGDSLTLTTAPSMERYEGFANAKFFEDQRREMVVAIRAIAEHVALPSISSPQAGAEWFTDWLISLNTPNRPAG